MKSIKASQSVVFQVKCVNGCTIKRVLKIGKKSHRLSSIAVPASGSAQSTKFKLSKKFQKLVKAGRKKHLKSSLVLTPTVGAIAGASVTVKVK